MSMSRRLALLTVVVGVVATVLPAVAPEAAAAPAPATAPWTNQKPALPAIANGEFTDVDCSTTTSCVAVGVYVRTGDATPLVERWNGSTWTLVDIPVPAGYRASAQAVSCATPSACVVAGYASTPTSSRAFVARLAGSRWTSQVLPKPAADLDGSLADVSCTSATSCVAVGSGIGFADEVTYTVPAAYRLVGTTWSPITPVQTGNGLVAVSCPTADWCAAVGTDRGGSVRQVFTGGVWNVRPLADTGTSHVRLAGISCTAPGDCAAVGGLTTDADTFDVKPAIETSTAGVWSLATIAPTVAASNGSLADVDCTSTTTCTAVGRLGDSTGTSTPLALRRGSTWTRQAVAAGTSDLRGVACPAATTCVTAGSIDGRVDNGDSTGVGLPVVLESVGSAAFTDTSAPAPTGFISGRFTAVSCFAADVCTAVGWAYDHSYATVPFVDRWDGVSWTLQALPDLGSGQLSGVSCANRIVCVAVGSQGDDVVTPLVLSWDGAAWTKTPIRKVTAATVGQFAAVSCPTTDECLAVGNTTSHGGNPIAAKLDGTRWTLTPKPPVGTDGDVTLTGVSCLPSLAQDCRVVGSGAANSSATRHGVDLGWDGTSWITGPPVAPSQAVSCTSSTACVATPTFTTSLPVTASRFDGTSWSAERLPVPAGTAGVEVNGVSCRLPLTCVAVGYGNAGANKAVNIWRRSSDGTWAREGFASSPTSTLDSLRGVDCPTGTRCVAVGSTQNLPVIALSLTS